MCPSRRSCCFQGWGRLPAGGGASVCCSRPSGFLPGRWTCPKCSPLPSCAMDGGCCSALLTNADKLIMERLIRQVIGTSERLDHKHSDSYFCENVPFTFWTGGTRTRGRLAAMSTLLCRLWRRRAVCAAGWVYVMQQMDGLLTSFLRINLLMTCSMGETRPSLG